MWCVCACACVFVRACACVSWTRAFQRRSVWCLETRRACWWWLTLTWSAASRAPFRSCWLLPMARCSSSNSSRVGLPEQEHIALQRRNQTRSWRRSHRHEELGCRTHSQIHCSVRKDFLFFLFLFFSCLFFFLKAYFFSFHNFTAANDEKKNYGQIEAVMNFFRLGGTTEMTTWKRTFFLLLLS